MGEALIILYFIGLIMLGIATGSHYGTAEYTFIIIGSGSVIFATLVGGIRYLHGGKG